MVMPVIAYGKIKPLRQAKGLNQAEIAAELGVSRPTYVLIEQGSKEPTITQLYTLARLLNIEPGELCVNLPSVTARVTDYQKFKELVRTCVVHGAEGGIITKSKLSVLVYLNDFAWYNVHGQPMTGADYRCTPRGPVADDYLRALDELYEAQAIALEPSGTAMAIRHIEQLPGRLLTSNELSLVQDICTKWRAQSTEAIIRFASEQAPCRAVRPGDLIPYEAILGEPQSALY
jgi:transcriptional regulator with XRE-family HTH domain